MKECAIFRCDRRGGNYCCQNCGKVITCSKACFNDPDKCGAYKKEEQ